MSSSSISLALGDYFLLKACVPHDESQFEDVTATEFEPISYSNLAYWYLPKNNCPMYLIS